MQKFCPDGFTATYGDVADIVFFPSRILFPKEMETSIIPGVLYSLVQEQFGTGWKNMLLSKVLQYWRMSLQQQDPVVMSEICKLVLDDQVPKAIVHYMENLTIHKLSEYAYIKFTLKGLSYSDSATTESYMQVSADGQTVEYVTSSAAKANITSLLNKSYLKDLSLAELELEEGFEVTHASIKDLWGFLENRIDKFRFVIPSISVWVRHNSQSTRMTHVFTIPRVRLEESRLVFAMCIFGTGEQHGLHATCSDILYERVAGGRFVKGKWISSPAKCAEDMTKEEAIMELQHFVSGGKNNVLLNALYELAVPAREDLVCLRHKSDDDYYILGVSDSDIKLFGIIKSDVYVPQSVSERFQSKVMDYVEECKLVIALKK